MGHKTIRTAARESRGRASDSAVRWSVERRLAFIDERLFWLGEVNRTDLMSRFGVSLGQASADIAHYLAHEPKGVFYDKKAKRYLADASFRPVLAAPDAARFLSELHLVTAGLLSVEHTLFGLVPPFDATPVPERKADPFVLRAVLGAIRKALVLDVMYQSMSRPEPMRRPIEPHALAHDGFRWHVRAFDQETSEFRDFVLGRLSKPKPAGPASSKANDDHDWNDFVESNPGLLEGAFTRNPFSLARLPHAGDHAMGVHAWRRGPGTAFTRCLDPRLCAARPARQ